MSFIKKTLGAVLRKPGKDYAVVRAYSLEETREYCR